MNAPGQPLVLPAPAKLNLFLHVLGRRGDGYHELQTVFQLLDLADRVTLVGRDDGRIRRAGTVGDVPESDDLALHAARALKEATGSACGADIELVKHIPVGAGLGGGSSDAATTLAGLNRLWGLELPAADLAALGLRLGADVPVFVHGLSAFAEGVGERLHPVVIEPAWYLVLCPGCAVSTPRVFAEPALTRNTPPVKIRDFVRDGVSGDDGVVTVRDWLSGTSNDCEAVVRKLHPEVDEALEWLSRFGAARMTGTGSSVFAPFEDERPARDALRQAPAGLRGFVTRGINESPLLALL